MSTAPTFGRRPRRLRSRRGGRTLLFACIAVSASLAGSMPGCRCADSDALAELVETKGQILRDFASAVGKWEGADVGAELRVGDAVMSKKSSEAVLRLSGDAYVRLAPESVIRFLEMQSRDKKMTTHGVDVETGEAEVVVGGGDVVLVTSVGMAHLEAGTRIRLKRAKEGVEYRVQIGEATFYDKENRPTVVKANEGIFVAIGSAVLDRLGAPPEPPKVAAGAEDTGEAPAPEDGVRDTAAETGELKRSKGESSGSKEPVVVGEGPDFADLSVAAGDSFVLHVASPPAAVEIRFEGKCPDRAALEIKKKLLSQGASAANVLLKAGRHAYKVRCLDSEGRPARDTVAAGSILVLKDAGLARLPRSAASSFVDTDGRHYKILYQTRIPNVVVRWPTGPKGQKYLLHLTSNKGKKTISAAGSEHTLKSGELSEGTHQIKFEARGALSRTSKTTTLDIRFDNAAPKASIVEPKDKSFAPGSKVSVSGVVVEDWNVSIPGGRIEMDAEHRFKGDAFHSPRFRAIALRLTHSKRGVHYYLRRAKGFGE